MNFPSLTWRYIYIYTCSTGITNVLQENLEGQYNFLVLLVPDIIQLKQQISVFTIMFYLEKHMKILLLDNLFGFLRVKYSNRCIMA